MLSIIYFSSAFLLFFFHLSVNAVPGFGVAAASQASRQGAEILPSIHDKRPPKAMSFRRADKKADEALKLKKEYRERRERRRSQVRRPATRQTFPMSRRVDYDAASAAEAPPERPISRASSLSSSRSSSRGSVRSIPRTTPIIHMPAISTPEKYKKLISKFITSRERHLNHVTWCDKTHPEGFPAKMPPEFFAPFTPERETFVQKLVVPKDAHVTVVGDIHGNSVNLLKFLSHRRSARTVIDENLKLAPNEYFVFTGDYSDRGDDSLEVWKILMLLAIRNPGQVFLLRGNHESAEMADDYGFTEEMERKGYLGIAPQFCNIFKILPQALFIGFTPTEGQKQQFILCCHGAFEPGYYPHNLLDFRREEEGLFCQRVYGFHNPDSTVVDPTVTVAHNNFVWGDFLRFRLEDKESKPSDRVSGFAHKIQEFNTKKAASILERDYSNGLHETVAVCRGHQHNRNPVGTTPHYKPTAQDIFTDTAKTGPIEKGTVYTFMNCGDLYKDGSMNPAGYGVLSIEDNRWKLSKSIQNIHEQPLPTIIITEPEPEISPSASPTPTESKEEALIKAEAEITTIRRRAIRALTREEQQMLLDLEAERIRSHDEILRAPTPRSRPLLPPLVLPALPRRSRL